MTDLLKYYILNIPKPLYLLGLIFILLLLGIRRSAVKEAGKRKRHDR